MAKLKKTVAAEHEEIRWPFGRRNYILFAVALAVLVYGYVELGIGSMTLAPLLLVIGYCVLIPAAILVKDPALTDDREPTANDA
ncbi:MAG: hypothetical protein ACE5FH_06170 [Candidatus Zixiibacteriota bacterium]